MEYERAASSQRVERTEAEHDELVAMANQNPVRQTRARNVVEGAERLRDSRVAAQHRNAKGSVTVDDLQTLRAEDIVAAVTEACAEKHVPLQL